MRKGSLGDGGYPVVPRPPSCLGVKCMCMRMVLSTELAGEMLSNDASRASVEAAGATGVLAGDQDVKVSPAEVFGSQSE